MNIEKKIEFLSSTFGNIQNLINLADSKANTSMTLQTFFLGIILGSSIIGGIFKKIIGLNNWLLVISYYFFFTVFVLTSITGIILCLLVLKARFPAEKEEVGREGLLYFNHINKFKNSQSYFEKINDLDEEKWLDELTKQVYSIAHIVSNKMKYINATITFLIINLFLSVILSLFSLYLYLDKG